MTEKILIVGPAWVGDMVMAHSLFQVLARQRDNPLLDVMAPLWTLPLLERFPEVRRGIPLPFSHGTLDLRGRWNLGKSLRTEEYDQAIVLPRSFKSAIIPYAARARRRTGYRGEMRLGLLNDIRPLDKNSLPRTVDRFINLSLDGSAVPSIAAPQPVLSPDRVNLQLAINRFGLDATTGRVLGLCPGAEYGPAKQWPAHHFAEVARRWAGSGDTIWLFGSEKDRAVCDQIQALSDDACVNLCGKTSLLDVVDLLSVCEAVVTNDSGLMHVAAAAGAGVIAIYGGSDYTCTPPLTDKKEILYSDIHCRPCFKRTCRYGHYRCLEDVQPENVVELLNNM